MNLDVLGSISVVRLRSLAVHIARNILRLPICSGSAQRLKINKIVYGNGGGLHRRFYLGKSSVEGINQVFLLARVRGLSDDFRK